jgi:hypothetical protein
MTAQTTQAAKPLYVAATTAAEARELADHLLGVMSELLAVIEHETELVRAGKLREAITHGPKKTELSASYVAAVGRLKVSQSFMQQAAPDLLTALHRHHDAFRSMLQVNLTVLATAHSISEKIVRGVNAEIQRRNIPNTYTAAGRRTTPSSRHLTPLAISRTL